MPRVEELIDRVAPATFITIIDLCKGYYQVPLAETAKKKTAFITPGRKYQFTRMPFGLKNAPATFQRLMDGILGGLEYAAAYIDDVVVASDTWDNHLIHLQEVLGRIAQAGLKVKKLKCVFGRAEVSFLGHRLGKGKVHPQVAKVEAVRNFTKPTTKKALRGFLGLVGYYRRFVPDFASNSATLTDATGKKHPDTLQWNDKMTTEFEYLRNSLSERTQLHTFDPQRETDLHTNASDRGIRGILLQVDKEGREVPIAYFSRSCCRDSRNTP